MKRQVKFGPETLVAEVGVLDTYMEELFNHGVPEAAKIRIETLPDGTKLTVNVEYEYDDEPKAPAKAKKA